MDEQELENETPVKKKKSKVQPKKKRKVDKIVIPRREPSIVIPPRQVVIITPDETTLKEAPYVYPQKLNPCLKSPLTLYEYAAAVVDQLRFPEAFAWTEEDVAEWMGGVVGLPEYKESIIANKINGRRLLMLEDPSHLPAINIRNFEHILIISAQVRKLFGTEFVKFCRSIGLPPRKPLTHCTWFKSRTGPSWGIRVNWSRCDVLRWMKIIMPEPVYRDHWDLVWYRKPEFPKVKFARLPKRTTCEYIPHYKEGKEEPCREILVPRKFRLWKDLPEEQQLIWMERPPTPPKNEEKKEKKKKAKPRETSLFPKPVNCEGLKGKDLILARRKTGKPKFLAEAK